MGFLTLAFFTELILLNSLTLYPRNSKNNFNYKKWLKATVSQVKNLKN